MFSKKAVNRVISFILSLTFICGQAFAGLEVSRGACRDTMAPSLVSDTDINPGRSEDFAKKIRPGQISNGIPMLAIAQDILPPRLTLEDREIAKLRDAIRLAVTLSAGYSQPEHRQIVKSTIQNLINLNNKLHDKTYLYNLIADSPEDYSAGFGFTKGFTGLTKELIDRLSIEDLAQYVFHENVPEDKVVLKEIKDERSAHRLVYNEIQTAIFGKEAVERLKKEIRAAINEKLLPLAEAAVRPAIAAGNWKMAVDTKDSAYKLTADIISKVVYFGYGDTEIVIAPSFVHLSEAREALGHISTIELAAQDVHFMESGAFTGEISVKQLQDFVSYIIIGHSERRRGETPESNALINKKVKTAVKNGFSVILCVGENLEEFEAGKTKQVIEDQIRNSLAGLTAEDMENVTIAYEPVWAIGTGKVATPEQANDNQRYIRALLLDMFGFETAAATRILYGGSVKPDNIKGLTIKPNVDGVLVGGASLKAEDFASIGKTIADEKPNKEKPAADQPSLAEVFRPKTATEPQKAAGIETPAAKARASSAETFAEFVKMAKAEAKALKIEAEGLGRIFVVGLSGSDASKAALEIGSSVGATCTLIPEMTRVDFCELVRDLKSYYQKHGFGLVIVADGAKIKKDRRNEELFDAALKKDGAARAIYEMAMKKGANEDGYLQFEKYADIVAAILSAELGKKEIGITVSQAGDIDYDTTIAAASDEKQAGIDRIDKEKYRKANAALFAEDEVETKKIVSGFDVFAPLKEGTIRYGILTGGGLASGHNQLIAEAVKEAYRQAKETGNTVEIIGLKSGWAGLIKEKLVNQARLLTPEEVGRYEKEGGSILGTSRTNPYSKENIEKGVPQILAENIKKLQLHGLITCGGDDTNGAASKLQAQFPALSFIGVPKTMDNDIPLPGGALNYGNRTFIEAGIRRALAYKKIAQNEKKIIVFEAFGRNSGFAALGVGAGVQATRTLVREEGVINFDRMAAEIEAFYNKNGYAVISVAEGIKTDMKGNEAIFEAAFKIDPVARALYNETKEKVDAFGHPKLKGAGRIITAILKAKLAGKGIVVEQKGNLDYGPRSADISAADLKMTNTLGKAAITKLLEGKKDIILYVDNDGNAGEMDLQKELGGRVADIKEGGANYREYLSANQAFSQKAAAAQDVSELLGNIRDTTHVTKDSVMITDRSKFVSETVDYLAFEAALSNNPDVKSAAQRILREAALPLGLKLGSINDFYMAKQEGKWANITVPAVNGRADVYHQYQQLFRVAKEKNVGALIVELARSEMRYSAQDAAEFTTISIASAIKQGYKGLIFAQGDHYQVNKDKYYKGGEDREKELKAIEALIFKSMQAGMYNIDLDPSTLVDEAALKQIVAFETEIVDRYFNDHPQLIAGLDENGIKSVRRKLVDEIDTGRVELLTPDERSYIEGLYKDMHKTSSEVTMHFIRYIRKLEKELGFPEGFHVSIGIEERHIDNPEHKNNPSTVLGSVALMQIVLDATQREGLVGPSKISLQTGTMHGVGGQVDFGIYQRHLEYWKRIGVAVFVQHGASTLEKQDFDKMREGDVGEVHLATEYQKIELDVTSRLLPRLGENMVQYLGEMMKKDAKMEAKFRPMWELATGNPKPAIDAIKPEDKKKDEKIALYTKLADVQAGKDRAVIINEILGDTTPKGIKGTLKDLVKELPGPFKRQLMNLSKEPRAAVDKALYEEFSTILHKLGATDTKSIVEEIVPFGKQPVIMPARPEALQKAVTALSKTTETTEIVSVPSVETAVASIREDLSYRAQVFAANLTQILAEHPDQLFFIGIETDIGQAQKAQIMPMYKAIDEIEKMTDSAGKKLFPNLMVRRATANELVTIVSDLSKEGRLNLNNAFIGARTASLVSDAYISIEGIAWIAAIDDSRDGDYLPVFEAITLSMMAHINADLAAIKSFYDAISDKPVDPDALQDMLKKRIIFILPRATKLDTDQLRKLYELGWEKVDIMA